jgi:hypothetical protein
LSEKLTDPDRWLTAVRELIEEMEIPEDRVSEYLDIDDRQNQRLEIDYEGQTANSENSWWLYLDFDDAVDDALDIYKDGLNANDLMSEMDNEHLAYYVSSDAIVDYIGELVREDVRESPEAYEGYLGDPHPEGKDYSDEEIEEMEDKYLQHLRNLDMDALLREIDDFFGDEFIHNMLENLAGEEEVINGYMEEYEMDSYEVAEYLDIYDHRVVKLPSGALAYGRG